jgi:hypothetical protein
MSPSFLVFLAQSQLGKSRYAKDIAALQMSHMASGTSFTSLDDLCLGLEHLDKLRGLPYGGAASIPKIPTKPPPKKTNGTSLGIVTAVQEADSSLPDGLELHKDAWVGAINLPEDRVKQLRQMFKCAQCRTNDHTLPSCPLLKNWIIKRKPRPDGSNDSDNSSRLVGGVNSVLADSLLKNTASDTLQERPSLSPIMDEPAALSIDDFAEVEFDLLENHDSLGVMAINGQVSAYSDLSIPLGSVRSVLSSQLTQD